MDFVDFTTRDIYFGNQNNPVVAPQQQPLRPPMNPPSTFPTIGTFSMETAMTTPNQNSVFGGGDSMSVLGNNSGPIGVFNSAAPSLNVMNNIGNSNNSSSSYPPNNNGSTDANQGTRETGIIEKLLVRNVSFKFSLQSLSKTYSNFMFLQHSYGFIQCCERQARLFFHFSQFGGNIEHLKIGDPVEFEMTYDRRTGKPIASQVTKIAPEVVLSEERVTGTVTTELKSDSANPSNTSSSSSDTTGRISYENRGECFFLPYTKDDVEGHVTLRAGDKVSFQIATNQR